MTYTSEWTKVINRGGLFEVGDATYLFFQTVEVQVKTIFKVHVPGGTGPEAELVKSVCSNEDVLFRWDLLTGSLSLDAQSALLRDFAQLWVTLHVHAFTKMILEEYKHCHHSKGKSTQGVFEEK